MAFGAYVGLVREQGESSSARYVDGVRAPRQAGSALKPFLYELAIEQRLLTAASLLDDSPVNLVTPSGLYVPASGEKMPAIDRPVQHHPHDRADDDQQHEWHRYRYETSRRQTAQPLSA